MPVSLRETVSLGGQAVRLNSVLGRLQRDISVSASDCARLAAGGAREGGDHVRVWLIKTGEPLPVDGETERVFRTGILAQLLVDRGHEVVWWTSTFDHYKKLQRTNRDTVIRINDRYDVEMLYSPGYRRNVSLRRIVDHLQLARKLTTRMERAPKPDVIFCAFPTIEMSRVAADYGQRHGVPVVIDVRDLWPETFVDLVPAWAKSIAKVLLSFVFRDVRKAFSKATAITGVTPAFVDWALRYAQRSRTERDRDFPLAYRAMAPSADAIERAYDFWRTFGITSNNSTFVVCFFGSMNRHMELSTVIEAARKLRTSGKDFRFVLCGTGDYLRVLRAKAAGCDNIIFPGWVKAPEIWTLMRMSSVGLAPYRRSPSFQASLPNKVIEYFSAGLPVLTSLDGTLGSLLSTYRCGWVYRDADELASQLSNLYDSPNLLKAASDSAHTLYEQKFVAENVYGMLVNYLEELAGVSVTASQSQDRTTEGFNA